MTERISIATMVLSAALLGIGSSAVAQSPAAKEACDKGKAFMDKGDYDSAITLFTEAIRIDPTYARLYCGRGIAFCNKGDHATAIADFNEAIRLDPQYAKAYCKRAFVYCKRQQYELSVADYTEAIRLNPSDADTYYNRGYACHKKGDDAQGDSDFERARQLGCKFCETPPLAEQLLFDLGGGVRLELVSVPAGEFTMGHTGSDSTTEEAHRVRITKQFYLGKYLVTQEQWQAVTGDNPSHFRGPKNPVETVSWNDCQRFLKKLGNMTSCEGFSLPTEAQWEWACRAGSSTRYCFTGTDWEHLEEQLNAYAWTNLNSGGTTHPVGEKRPNAWGLYDMHGNVWEWCADWYDWYYYSQSPVNDPVGPQSATKLGRVFRGGAWNLNELACGSYDRNGREPDQRTAFVGFRVCKIPNKWGE
jgi:formylglycine-generating enzyme required for sulfatase activity